MTNSIDTAVLNRFDLASQYEWLETNGLGGYSCSSIIGTLSRRYHGLLVAASKPPVGRQVILSKMDETIHVPETAKSYDLGCNKYQGAIFPNGYIFQKSFSREQFPTFVYRTNGIEVQKTIAAIHGENTVVILYEVLKANHDFCMELLPLSAIRDHHHLGKARELHGYSSSFINDTFHSTLNLESEDLYIKVPGAHFKEQGEWYFNFEYSKELERGMEGHEDLFSPGRFYANLHAGAKLGIIVSTENPGDRDAWQLFEGEKKRRKLLENKIQSSNPFIKELSLAADQFVVQRGNGRRSIIAGYPWFTDWGRDTMISIPGLCLATGRYEDAKRMLEVYAENLSQGMIPNRFPDDGERPVYNTIDASLWFFVAAHKYLKATKDLDAARETLLPAMKEILDWHQKGTRFNIKMEEDGLLRGGEAGYALTWMDAKVGDWTPTPRYGKAVEINALWYNAWEIYRSTLRMLGKREEMNQVSPKAKWIRKQFVQNFWNEETGALYDLIDGDHKDASIRPNQVFAISLPYTCLSPSKAASVLNKVEQELLTPVGLRSLSHKDHDFRGKYCGNLVDRDAAYHQGTVWSWLMGPYMDASIRVKGSLGKEQSRQLISYLEEHYRGEGAIGSISEIFDGNANHKARGCFAQAWSIAEILRVSHEHQLYAPSIFQGRKKTRKRNTNQELVHA
ncbi:MAG: amylo-alpha-1,6-glucosidase [Bacteroidota bacterium]